MDPPTLPRSWLPRFGLIWLGQQFSLVGSHVAQFALVWWLTQKTGSATVLATATLVAILPSVFLGPFVGALVDRWNRRLIMICADGVVALAAVWLVYLFWTGAVQIWHLYVIMLIRSIGQGFHWPAMVASTSLMVPSQHLHRLAGINQTVQGGVNIVSPPLSALLLSILPLHAIMGIDVLTALLAILPLCFIVVPQPQRSDAAAVITPATLWADVRVGLRFLWGWPGLLMLLLMATAINFFLNPAFALLPILVTQHFGGEALELGWINSAWGLGVVAGGLILGVWGGFKRRILTTLVGLVGLGLGPLVIGLSPATAFGLALAGMFWTGLMGPIVNGPIMALMQTLVPAEMQGRVFTVIQSLAGAMMPLGLIIAGPVADLLGVRTWYILGGAACALLGVAAFFVPAIIRIEDGRRRNALPVMS